MNNIRPVVLILILFSFVFSCSTKTREERVYEFLKKSGVAENAFVGILNPDYCGSCTDYSIKWLQKKIIPSNQDKIILLTGKLKSDFKTKLYNAGYSFILVNQDRLGRLGITLTACTSIIVNEGKVISIQIVK
jgi:hypothetical protein